MTVATMRRAVVSWLMWLVLAGMALQLFWLVRIGFMPLSHPESTAVQRSEIARLWRRDGWGMEWYHTPMEHGLITDQLRRAVVASEDAKFFDHHGVDWLAVQAAWQRNQSSKSKQKVVGGSTITQQLAKNLFLSGERNLVRKAQELVITGMLELVLSKRQILDIYLNHVEWGEGVFGAEEASQAYFDRHAWTLNATQAARLAVMLPSPKRFEDNPNSRYLRRRSDIIRQRMRDVAVPQVPK
jgi:monofunctional glycosyltransferase